MPKYDLAGNPLPEPGGPSAPPAPGMPRPSAPPPAYAPPPGDAAPVRRDLAGNVIPAAPPTSQPGGPMPGYSPGPQASLQPGTWPPPPAGGYSVNPTQAVNDSGAKAGVPPEVAALKWNWGAFGMTWLWCLNHGLVAWGVGLLVGSLVLGVIPGGGLIPLAASIYFGVMGHKMGWQNRHFPGGVSQFTEVERAWMKWAVGLLVASLLIIPILAALLFPIFARARMQARMRANGGYTQPFNAPAGGSPGGAPGGQ